LECPRITRNNANILKASHGDRLGVGLAGFGNAAAGLSEFSLASIRIFRGQDSLRSLSLPSVKKECFGGPPKPTREPRALPRLLGFLFSVISRVWRIIKIIGGETPLAAQTKNLCSDIRVIRVIRGSLNLRVYSRPFVVSLYVRNTDIKCRSSSSMSEG